MISGRSPSLRDSYTEKGENLMLKKGRVFNAIVLLVLFSLVMTALAACGGGATATPAATGTATATATVAAGGTETATATETAAATETASETATQAVATEKGGQDILIFNNGAEPETLDPALMTGNIEFTIAQQIFEGLTNYGKEDVTAMEPGVASSWDLSNDQLTYTFHLRDDAKWSNGDPVTASDFVYSWERVLKPETASEYAYQLFYIKGAEDYNAGKTTDFTQVGVKAVDDRTLEVTLNNPTPYFLQLTAFQTLFPVQKATVDKFADKWTLPENIVTNGAFLLKTWSPNDKIIMEKNPSYWDVANVKLNKAVAYPVDDNNTALSMYEAGEVDWIRTIPLEAVDQWKGNPEYYNNAELSTYFYRFNVTKPPFDKVEVRKAFDMAIDKQAIVENVTRMGQQPAKAYVPPGMPGYTSIDDQGLPYDPAAAKAELAKAYPDLSQFPATTLLYNTSESHKAIAEAIQAMWKQNLGVNVELLNQEWKVYLKSQSTLDYQVSRSGWIGDYIDPNTFLDMFVTDGGNNQTGWSNKQYDDLIAKAAQTTDKAERMKLFQQAEKILVLDEMPIAPIYYYTNNNLVKPYVKGMTWNLQDIHLLKNVSVESH